MSPINKNPKKIVGFGCLFVALVSILLMASFAWLLFSGKAIFYTNKKNQFRVASVFMEALRAKRLDVAQSLVIEEQKERLEEWMAGREPVDCPMRLDFESEIWGVGSSYNDGMNYRETRGLRLPCPEPEKMYCLLVEDMLFEKRGEAWVITDWGEISEYWRKYSCGY